MQIRGTVAVVMPAHNESGAIGSVISRIPEQVSGMNVATIVVDDGSSDLTAQTARSHGALVVRHMTNLGVGAATITGLRAASELDADIIVTMDADGQHNPADIERLVNTLLEGKYDVVIGSRLLDWDGMPLTRVAANLFLNAVTYLAYGKIVSDSQSGFKVFSRAALERMDLRSVGYEVCSEIIGEIYRKNLCYKSEPVKAVYTQYSRSKGQPLLNGVNIIIGILMRFVRRV